MNYLWHAAEALWGLGLPTTAIALLAVYLASSAAYNLTIHPLASIPGPWWTALSRLPWVIARIRGYQVQWIQSLHLRYGPVVRYCPDELSYVDQGGAAWKAIYGQEKGSREFPRVREWYIIPFNG